MKVLKQVFKAILFLAIGFLVVTFLWVLTYRYINPPISTMMLHQSLQNDEEGLQYTWVDIEEINIHLPISIIAGEDQLFLKHSGFDLVAIEDAFYHNKNGGKLRGASTISQQLAKNLFLWPGKTFLRKGLEAYFTGLMELLWTKKRIMEIYMNVVEWGPNVYGAEAAAQKYFRKKASDLNMNEAAVMAAVLPNPIIFSLSNPPAKSFRKKNWILVQVKNLGGVRVVRHWYPNDYQDY